MTKFQKFLKVFIPIVGVGVILFGISLSIVLKSSLTIKAGWNFAWGSFDIFFGLVVLATWWAAHARKWWAIALAGAVNAVQVIDVLFTLTVYFDVSERPGILFWALIIQPVFGYLIWHYVLAHVRPSVIHGVTATGRTRSEPVHDPGQS